MVSPFVVSGKVIGDDKHFSSNSSVVISLNNTLITSGIFLNYTNGYVSLYNVSIGGILPIPKIGLKPSSNITINKIGNYKLNYTGVVTSIDKIWIPVYGVPSSIIGGSLITWDNINKIINVAISSIKVEINWILPISFDLSFLMIGALIFVPMSLILVLILGRKRR